MRNIIGEILERKARNVSIRDWVSPSRLRWELVSNRITAIKSIPHAINILDFVCYSLETNELEKYSEIERENEFLEGNVLGEIARYIPIGLVACVEAYFRQVYVDLISCGDPYKKNAVRFSKRIKSSFDIETAISLETAGLSIGDFIGHLVSVNNFEDIESTMTQLTDKGFSEELQKEIENSNELQQVQFMFGTEEDNLAEGYRVVSQGLVVPTAQKIYRDMVCDIKDVFELRHKLCHEAAPISTDDDKNTISKAPASILKFLVISEAVVERMLSQPAI